MTDYTSYRNRHLRGEEFHFGTMEATLVELSEALGAGLPAGTTLEAAIAIIDERLTRLENADVTVASILANAYVVDASFPLLADAIIKASLTGSFTADAVRLQTLSASFAADAYLAELASSTNFTADAVLRALQSGSFTADAIRRALIEGAVTADATVLATSSGSLAADAWLSDGSTLFAFAADAILKKTQKTGRFVMRYGTIQTQANAGTYTQNMNVGSNPKALGVYILGAQSGSMASFSTWTFNATDTISFRVLKEFLSTRVYLFDNITPSAMSGVVEVKAVVTGSVGTFSFVPFAIETDETVTRLDTAVDGAAGTSTLYTFDTGTTKAVGLIGRAGTDGTTSGLTSFFSSPSGYDAGYETAAPRAGSRSIGFNINGSHAWVGVAYGLGDIGSLTPITADAVIFRTQSASFTADAYLQLTIVAGSFTTDATVKATRSAAFTANAVISTGVLGFTADAYITDGSALVDPLWAYENAWAQEDAVLNNTAHDTISEYERSS